MEQVFTEIDGEIWREIVLAQNKGKGGNEERNLSNVGNPKTKPVEKSTEIKDGRTKGKEEAFEGTKPTTNLTILNISFNKF